MQHPSLCPSGFFVRASISAVAVAIAVACSGSETPGSGAPGADAGSSSDDAASGSDATEQDAAPSADHTVSVTNFVYSPKTLTIKAGQTVEWVFKTGTHTVTSGGDCKKDGRFDSGVHKSPFTFRHTFEQTGTFEYFCDYMDHCGKGQVGTIKVE